MQTLTIQGEMIDLNTYVNAERGNRYHAAAIKKAETERVYWACKEQRLKSMPDGISLIQCDRYTKDLRKDADNVSFAQKFCFDGLVLAGVLPNDTRRYTGSIHHNFLVDKRRPRVEVTLQ